MAFHNSFSSEPGTSTIPNRHWILNPLIRRELPFCILFLSSELGWFNKLLESTSYTPDRTGFDGLRGRLRVFVFEDCVDAAAAAIGSGIGVDNTLVGAGVEIITSGEQRPLPRGTIGVSVWILHAGLLRWKVSVGSLAVLLVLEVLLGLRRWGGRRCGGVSVDTVDAVLTGRRLALGRVGTTGDCAVATLTAVAAVSGIGSVEAGVRRVVRKMFCVV